MILDARRVAGDPLDRSGAVPTAVKASIDLALLGIAFLEFLNLLRKLLDRSHRVRTGGAGPPDSQDDMVMNTSEAWAATLRRQRHIGDFTRWKDHDA
jgi:hypothetical protein